MHLSGLGRSDPIKTWQSDAAAHGRVSQMGLPAFVCFRMEQDHGYRGLYMSTFQCENWDKFAMARISRVVFEF